VNVFVVGHEPGASRAFDITGLGDHIAKGDGEPLADSKSTPVHMPIVPLA
jgi:hypothetical protein